MRVTHQTLVRAALGDLAKSAAAMAGYQRQLSSGKRINIASDDPFGAERALGFRASIGSLEQAQRGIAQSENWLNATDATLDTLNEVLVRARVVAIEGSSDSSGSDATTAMSAEAAQLLGSALESANTSSGGWYLFAGFQVDTPPFEGLDSGGNVTSDPEDMVSVRYNGDGGQIVRDIEPGVNMTINISGADGWLDPAAATSVFATMIDLRDALGANDSDAVLGTVDRLDDLISQCSRQRGIVGAKLQRLSLADDKLTSMSIGLKSLLSQTEDADMAEAMVNYSQQEAIYNAALKVNSQILPMSLFNYLQ
ncbi:MAG: flagellar hook-associated protein FlgL [Anaerolineae bacterium]